jgi:predicted nucleic acid-binding Zn ribbon protein
MERASKLIRGLRLPTDTISAEELACSAWAEAVGKKIAAHTRAVRLVRTRLVVEVEDKTWQRQLMTLTPFIVCNLQKHLGSEVVDDLEFRAVPRRREPQRALAAFHASVEPDEADAIADPVMRGLYKASRKRALA